MDDLCQSEWPGADLTGLQEKVESSLCNKPINASPLHFLLSQPRLGRCQEVIYNFPQKLLSCERVTASPQPPRAPLAVPQPQVHTLYDKQAFRFPPHRMDKKKKIQDKSEYFIPDRMPCQLLQLIFQSSGKFQPMAILLPLCHIRLPS